jgi:hypothetical protein
MAKFDSENNPGMRFPPGRSGNPVGRPRSVDKLRREVAGELVRHAPALTRMAVQKALAGDAGCLAACLQLLRDSASDTKRATPEPVVKSGE